MAVVGLARSEDCRRPLRFVRSVRIFLGLEADGSPLVVNDAALAGHASVKEVSGVNLNARLVGIDVKGDAGLLAVKFGCKLIDVALGVENPVVVITVAVDNLLAVSLVDPVSNLVEGEEIHWSALYRKNLTRGHTSIVNRGEARSVDIQIVAADIGGRVSREVEIRVIGHIDDSRRGGGSLVCYLQAVVISKGIGGEGSDLTREIVVTVR